MGDKQIALIGDKQVALVGGQTGIPYWGTNRVPLLETKGCPHWGGQTVALISDKQVGYIELAKTV